MRLVVRRGALSDVEAIVEPLKTNPSGVPNDMAFVMSTISLRHKARARMTVDHTATHRSHPEDFHRLFAKAVHMQQVYQVVRDGINNVVTVSGRDGKRSHSVSDKMLSTAWNAAGLLSKRPANPEDLVAKGCCCPAIVSYQFPTRFHRGCLAGIFRPKASMDFNHVRTFSATLRPCAMACCSRCRRPSACIQYGVRTCTEVWSPKRIQLCSAWRLHSAQPRRRYGTPPTSAEQPLSSRQPTSSS